MRSLATLACIVLRKCLPKTLLPLSSKENPIKFHLPSQTLLGSEDDDSHKPEDTFPSQIHICRSAPQLSQIPYVAASHDSLTRAREHQDTAREHQSTVRKAKSQKKKSSSSSSSSGVSSSSLEPLDLSAFPELQPFITAPLLDSALVKEREETVHNATEEEEKPAGPSDSDNLLTDARFFEITSSPENINLSQFDDFFPELQQAADIARAECENKICKTQSVPVLSLTSKETVTSTRDVYSPPSTTGECGGKYLTVGEHAAKTPVNDPRSSPIVVPTAILPSSELTADSTSDDEGISFKTQTVGAPATDVAQFDNTTLCAVGTPATDGELPKTLEQPHPQLLGHIPPSAPEPYYRKTPAVER